MAFIALSLLFACLPKQPEIPLTEVPPAPLLAALEQRRKSFSSMKAVAGVEAVRQGRKRSFESVGIVLAGQDRLRIEAYDPLGQSLFALVWDGHEVLYRLPGQDRVMKPGMAGLEGIFGVALDVQDLSAALAGNLPEIPSTAHVTASCGRSGICELTMRQGDLVRRVQALYLAAGGAEPQLTPLVHELFRGKRLVYRARFEQREDVGHYLMPMMIVIENPDKNFSLTIRYAEVDVNVPVAQELFSLPDEGGTP